MLSSLLLYSLVYPRKILLQKVRDEADAMDVHSAANIRVNAAFSLMPEFTRAFQCKKNDRMFIKEEQSCYIFGPKAKRWASNTKLYIANRLGCIWIKIRLLLFQVVWAHIYIGTTSNKHSNKAKMGISQTAPFQDAILSKIGASYWEHFSSQKEERKLFFRQGCELFSFFSSC